MTIAPDLLTELDFPTPDVEADQLIEAARELAVLATTEIEVVPEAPEIETPVAEEIVPDLAELIASRSDQIQWAMEQQIHAERTLHAELGRSPYYTLSDMRYCNCSPSRGVYLGSGRSWAPAPYYVYTGTEVGDEGFSRRGVVISVTLLCAVIACLLLIFG